MKIPALQVAFFLSAYSSKDVVEGFKIYNNGIESGLSKQGWKEQDEKPIDREYFELDGKYWIQDKPKPVLQSKNKNDILNKVKPLSPFMVRVKEFLSAKFGPRVIESEFEKRKKICGIGQPEQLKCEYLKIINTLPYCSGCGCGEKKDAMLENKLRMANVSCPRIPGLFNKVTEPNLLQK